LASHIPTPYPPLPRKQFWLDPVVEPWPVRSAKLRRLNAELCRKAQPAEEVLLRIQRASLLTGMGQALDARADHLRVIELDPSNLINLLALGRLLAATGHSKAAQTVFAEAVKHHPNEVACHVNLGSSLLVQGHDPLQARKHYEAALRLDPELPEANGGMFYALTQLGEFEAARLYQRKAFGQKNFFHAPFRGPGKPISLLLLLSSNGGNTPIEKLLDDRVFEVFTVIADYFPPDAPLPAHQLAVNGIGDPDVAAEALHAAQILLARSSAPVLNAPEAVLASSRCRNAGRLAAIPGIITPRTASLPYSVLEGPEAAQALACAGFAFPLLLRAPGFHMGQHFVRVEAPAHLADAVAELPGAGRPQAELLAIQYLEARGADGLARKYRVMMVGGKLYPLHLAISPNWKIHYFSADMADRPDHRAEEALFLSDMTAALGSKAVAALERLQGALALDYGGADFGLSPDGEVLLFEANATMIVEPPPEDPRWDYRRANVERIHAAVRDLLQPEAHKSNAASSSR
jgi:tetratricopeptide (TPR) repeat protein